MNQQSPAQSLPIDPLSVASNYFSLCCLEFSFQLLREQHPTLALAIQNLTAEARLKQLANSDDKLLALDLDVQLVSDIVSALSDIAEHAAGSDEHDRDTMIAIHQTLLNWLLYAQTFLDAAPASTPSQKP